MKKIILALLLCLLFFTVVSCEEKSLQVNDLDLFRLQGPVETVLVEMDYGHTNITDASYLVTSIKLTFNDQGFMTSETRVNINPSNPDAKPRLSSEKYYFESSGRIQKQMSHSQYGELTETTFLYKDDANLPYAGISDDKDNPYMTTLNYDAVGRLISVSLYDKESNNILGFQTTYNEHNQKTSHKNIYQSEILSERRFTYNTQGYVSSITEYDQDNSKSLLTYEYLKTDSYGNWLQRKAISDKKPGYVIEKRTVNYY